MIPIGEKLYIDRIEGDCAVVEHGGEMIDIPLLKLPDGVREGTVLTVTENGYEADEEAEAERRKLLFSKQNALFNRKSE